MKRIASVCVSLLLIISLLLSGMTFSVSAAFGDEIQDEEAKATHLQDLNGRRALSTRQQAGQVVESQAEVPG